MAESDETAMGLALARALPAFEWGEGDSSWDKVRVWGTSADTSVRIYRYESPGPFDLTIVVKGMESAAAERTYLALRDRVLLALEAAISKRLEPQPVSLVKPEGKFPAAYQFECDLGIRDIKKILDDAEFWSWELFEKEPLGLYLEGRILFGVGGRVKWTWKERVLIAGVKPSYRLEILNWHDEPGRCPSFDQVHEAIQSMMLPGIGARNVRAGGGR